MSKAIQPTPSLTIDEYRAMMESLSRPCSSEEWERRIIAAKKRIEEMTRRKALPEVETPFFRFMSLTPMYPVKPYIYINNA